MKTHYIDITLQNKTDGEIESIKGLIEAYLELLGIKNLTVTVMSTDE